MKWSESKYFVERRVYVLNRNKAIQYILFVFSKEMKEKLNNKSKNIHMYT